MARISPELLESEYESYMGLKYFLKSKEDTFWNNMNSKYHFTKEEVVKEDHDAYKYIKENFTKELPMK